MSGNFLALAQPGVQQLSPYVPGKPVDELARELDLDPAKIVKLASNENPLGASPKALAAIREELAELTRYPDGNGFALKSLLAEQCRVDLNQVTLGNGSNDILELVARAYLAPGLNAVFSEHAFAVYPIATQAVGAQAKVVPAKDWGHDLPAMLAAIDANTRVVFIANPNNPTGTFTPRAEIARLHAGLPRSVLLVLDQAYAEYLSPEEDDAGLALAMTEANVLVTRTFSKIHGLAAERIGWGYACAPIIDAMHRIRAPFNVTTAGQAAAVAALADTGFVDATRAHNDRWRGWFVEQVAQMGNAGLRCVPSKANFVLVLFEGGLTADTAYHGLMEAGYIVRWLPGQGLPNALRITIGTEEETRGVTAALRALVEAA